MKANQQQRRRFFRLTEATLEAIGDEIRAIRQGGGNQACKDGLLAADYERFVRSLLDGTRGLNRHADALMDEREREARAFAAWGATGGRTKAKNAARTPRPSARTCAPVPDMDGAPLAATATPTAQPTGATPPASTLPSSPPLTEDAAPTPTLPAKDADQPAPSMQEPPPGEQGADAAAWERREEPRPRIAAPPEVRFPELPPDAPLNLFWRDPLAFVATLQTAKALATWLEVWECVDDWNMMREIDALAERIPAPSLRAMIERRIELTQGDPPEAFLDGGRLMLSRMREAARFGN